MLLLCMCSRSSRVADATTYFRRALSLDPFLWSAFQSLCQLGALPHPVMGPESMFFRVDLSEFAAANEGASLHAHADASASAPAPLLSPSRRSRPHAPLLTPSSAVLPHLHMLSLTTPTPRQALFSTPFTRDVAQPAAAASVDAAAGSASFLTPPAAEAATATSSRTPARAKQGFSSPQAAKARPRGHVRAHSALSSSFAGSSAPLGAPALSAAASAAGVRTTRKVSSRLQWDSTPSSDARTRSGAAAAAAAGGAGSEYSSDDATASERERNEKKVGRRINRGTTQGEKVTVTRS